MSIKGQIKKIFFGKKRYQSLFRRLFAISLEGMNIGVGGQGIGYDGEEYALRYSLKGQSKPVIFDVGAQGGKYSEYALTASEGPCDIYAFEPCARDYDILAKLFVDPSIHLVKSALGEKEGQADLYYPEDVRGLSTLLKPEKSGMSEKVSVETIDSFCQKNGIKYITMLKLDTEGYELACLKGARSMLPNIKNIQFEISLSSRDARSYFKDIFDLLSDYDIYRIIRDGLVPVKSPDKLSELLFTTNYLACRKD